MKHRTLRGTCLDLPVLRARLDWCQLSRFPASFSRDIPHSETSSKPTSDMCFSPQPSSTHSIRLFFSDRLVQSLIQNCPVFFPPTADPNLFWDYPRLHEHCLRPLLFCADRQDLLSFCHAGVLIDFFTQSDQCSRTVHRTVVAAFSLPFRKPSSVLPS